MVTGTCRQFSEDVDGFFRGGFYLTENEMETYY